MHRLKLLVSFLILAGSCFGLPYSKRLDTAVNNLATTSYTAILSEGTYYRTLIIDNRTAKEIEVNCNSGDGQTPALDASANPNVFYVNATQTLSVDNPNIKSYCFARAVPSTLTSGVIVITGIGD